MGFSRKTREHLAHYVYGLVDPRDNKIFYVGKASGNNRAFDHLRTPLSGEAKSLRIQEIRSAGMEPEVDVLRYGLPDEGMCFEVEAAIIDAIGLENLTNEVRGHGIDRGRQTAADVERLHGAEPVNVEEVSEPLMLFFINRTYTPTLTEQELYDATRQFWYEVSAKTRTPRQDTGHLPYPTALAVADSVVVRAYSVAAWFPAGTTHSTRWHRGSQPDPDRWEFVGQFLEEHPLLGRRLLRGGKDILATQKGYTYIN